MSGINLAYNSCIDTAIHQLLNPVSTYDACLSLCVLDEEQIAQHSVKERIKTIFISNLFAMEGVTALGRRVPISTDGIQMPPSLNPQKLSVYISHLSFLLTQQNNGDYILKAYVKGVGGGNGFSIIKTPNQKLLDAVLSGDRKKAELAVEEGANVNISTFNGRRDVSMLKRAIQECTSSKYSIVNYLLIAGAKPTQDDLNIALYDREFAIASLLIKKGLKPDLFFLDKALKNKDISAIELCLNSQLDFTKVYLLREEVEKGADTSFRTYEQALDEEKMLHFNSFILSKLSPDFAITDVLSLAANAKRMPIKDANNARILSLLERGVDFSSSKFKEPYIADSIITHGINCYQSYEVTELLIKSKAKLLPQHLTAAIKNYNYRLLSLLISSGLKPTVENVIAALSLNFYYSKELEDSHKKIIVLLFDAGAPANLSEEEMKRLGAKSSPLYLAINQPASHIFILYLIEKGANIYKLPRRIYAKIPSHIQNFLLLKFKTDAVFLKAMETLTIKIMNNLPEELLQKLSQASKMEELKAAINKLLLQDKKIIFEYPLVLGIEDSDLVIERKDFVTKLSNALLNLLNRKHCFEVDKKHLDLNSVEQCLQEAMEEWYAAIIRQEEQKLKEQKILDSQQALLQSQNQTNNQLEDAQKNILQLEETIRELQNQTTKNAYTQGANLQSIKSQVEWLQSSVNYNTIQLLSKK